MVSDQQVKRLWRLTQTLSLEVAAAKAGMDPKTARKYLRARRLPSEMRQKHTWRTRPDPFAEVWKEVEQVLKVEPGLQAKTLFEYLQERQPGRFSEGQVRTLQRRIKTWRALEGLLGKCSSRKITTQASCANRISRTAANWESRLMGNRFHI